MSTSLPSSGLVFVRSRIALPALLLSVLTFGVWPPPALSAPAPLVLTEGGQSRYVLYHAAGAPKSVVLAAEEIQRALEISTGVRLPVVQEPRTPMICLGDNPSARAAGFDAGEIPDEGFRIGARGEDLFIVGKDWPDEEKKWISCDSTGTLFGAYEFLERWVGVRWLMPGPLGEDIPQHRERLVIEPVEIADAPAVPHRTMGISYRGATEGPTWLRRRRMGKSIAPSWGHNFAEHPSTEVLKAHPEYMPLRPDGTREQPVGDRSWGNYEHKLCLSNPGLVQAFGDSLVQYLEKNPRRQGASVAPADGGTWCVCKECQAPKLMPPSPEWGTFAPYGHSMTPLVLQFYNGVARGVGAKSPDRPGGGLLYPDYHYPPPGKFAVEPNVYLALAINAGYGFKFYKPETAGMVGKLIRRWAEAAPMLGWTDYSTWMRNPIGAPLPPGLPILKTIFPAFGRSLKVINYQGQEAWGYAGAHNYVVSRLMWNNNENIDALYEEFLTRAYGPAAPQMRRLYATVEDSLRKYIVEKPYPDHEIWYDTAQLVYAPLFPELERVYLEAAKQPLSEVQRKRLEMLGDNLVVLHWNLRSSGLLKDGEKSTFFRDEAAYRQFVAERGTSPALVNLATYIKYRWQTALWAPEVRTLEAVRLPKGAAPPQVDGSPAEDAWKTAAVADQFRTNQGERGPAEEQTVVRACCDDQNLYLAFECAAREPAKIRKACTARNSPSIFSDDVVELFMQPGGGAVRHLAVNAGGVTFSAPAGEVQGAAAIGAGGWTAELVVPLASLGAAGQPVRANFTRRKVGPPIDQSAWCRVEERLGDARAFGELRFGK